MLLYYNSCIVIIYNCFNPFHCCNFLLSKNSLLLYSAIQCPQLTLTPGLIISTLYNFDLTSRPDPTSAAGVPVETVVFFSCDSTLELNGYQTIYCRVSNDGSSAVWSAAYDFNDPTNPNPSYPANAVPSCRGTCACNICFQNAFNVQKQDS